MSERETKEFTTSGGHKVILRTYLTGREANEIKSLMYSVVKMGMDDTGSGKVNMDGMSGTFIVQQEEKALGFLVVSVDGNATAPVDMLLDLPAPEYEAVVKEVNAIQNPTTPEK